MLREIKGVTYRKLDQIVVKTAAEEASSRKGPCKTKKQNYISNPSAKR